MVVAAKVIGYKLQTKTVEIIDKKQPGWIFSKWKVMENENNKKNIMGVIDCFCLMAIWI